MATDRNSAESYGERANNLNIEILILEDCGNKYLGYWDDNSNSWIDSGGMVALDTYTDFDIKEKNEFAKIDNAAYWMTFPKLPEI